MGLKIFIIEDDPTYSKILSFRLKNDGHKELILYDSGESSLQHIREKPDLVLLDFSLKGLNGLDTLLQIKKESPKSEVIVLTGLDSQKVADECKNAGALEFLNKEEESILKILELAKDLEKKKSKSANRLVLGVLVAVVLIIFLLVFLF